MDRHENARRMGRNRNAQSWTISVAAATLLGSALSAGAADCRSSAAPQRDWSGCNRSNLMLSGSDLTGANLSEADVGLSDLRNAVLTSANLESAKMARTSLAGSVADGANFSGIEGYRTNFSKVSARNASFRSAELQRTNFSGAVLTGSSFEKAELGRAVFEGAALGGNAFGYANLARASLKNARIEGQLDFTGAYLFLARIEGADLSAATGLTQAQVDIACGDPQTRLPAGLSAPKGWPCRFD